MRWAAALLSAIIVFTGSGCVVVAATAVAIGTVTATSVKTAGKVTAATVKTTGRVATAALTSSGEVAALSLESAAKLARTGMVVLVDGSNGTIIELPWQQGMQLYSAVQAASPDAGFRAARIFREGRQWSADLKAARSGAADPVLRPRDVVELLR